MIFDSQMVETSACAVGCTFECEPVRGSPPDYPELDLNIFDTVGMCESMEGTVPSEQAIKMFEKLTSDIDGGIHILLFCMKKGRLTQETRQAFKFFVKDLCDTKVPSLLVITRCEEEGQSLNAWWEKSRSILQNQLTYEIAEGVPVTTIKDKQIIAGEHYEQSRRHVIEAIERNALSTPWRPTRLILYLRAWRNFWRKPKLDEFEKRLHGSIEQSSPLPNIAKESSSRKHRNNVASRSPPCCGFLLSEPVWHLPDEIHKPITSDMNNFKLISQTQDISMQNAVVLVVIDDYRSDHENALQTAISSLRSNLENQYQVTVTTRKSLTAPKLYTKLSKLYETSTKNFKKKTNTSAIIIVHLHGEDSDDVVQTQTLEKIRDLYSAWDALTKQYRKYFFVTMNPYSCSNDDHLNAKAQNYNSQLVKCFAEKTTYPAVKVLEFTYDAESTKTYKITENDLEKLQLLVKCNFFDYNLLQAQSSEN